MIARATDGQLPIRREPTHVGTLLGGVRDRFADRAARRDRVIRVEDGRELHCDVDPVRMRQALGNLVENALRHGAGQISLRARRCADGVEIDVTDEGPGLPPNFTGRAFERFSRGDRSRSSQGVGLGLAIVATIAQAHGGTAAVVATSPATLRISLPDAG